MVAKTTKEQEDILTKLEDRIGELSRKTACIEDVLGMRAVTNNLEKLELRVDEVQTVLGFDLATKKKDPDNLLLGKFEYKIIDLIEADLKLAAMLFRILIIGIVILTGTVYDLGWIWTLCLIIVSLGLLEFLVKYFEAEARE